MLTVLPGSIICIQIYLYSNTGIQIYHVCCIPCSSQPCPEPEKNQRQKQTLEQQLEFPHPNKKTDPSTWRTTVKQDAESFQLVGAVASLPQFQRETLYTGRFFALGESWLNYRKQHKDVKPLGFSLLILKRLYQTLVRKRILKLLAEKAVKSYKMKVNRAADFGIEI